MRKLEDAVLKQSLRDALDILEKDDIQRIVVEQKNFSNQQNALLAVGNTVEIDNLVKKVKGQMYLFTEEFVPSDFVLNTDTSEILSSENEELILDSSYKLNLLPPKAKKLKELYNISVYVGPIDGKVSYKSLNNLNDEIARILNKTKFAEIKAYFDNLSIPNYSREFLKINGNTQNMFKSKRILVYSALLNFDWSTVTLELGNSKNFLDILESENLITSGMTETNWKKLCEQFSLFLDQLMARTIHYTD